jgi:putative two-component system response regulator
MPGHGHPSPVTILIVDDDDRFRPSLAKLMAGAGYDCREADNGADARGLLDSGANIAAVLCDVQMPGGSGLELLAHLAADFPDVAVVMTHGIDDPETARLAFEIGADGYLIKPFTNNEILITVANAVRLRQVDSQRRGQMRGLEHTVNRLRTLTVALQRIDNVPADADNDEDTVDQLSVALSLRDDDPGQHIERMTRYSALLAESVGCKASAGQVRLATALHDVGNIGVPDTILAKPGPLSPDERRLMRRHARIGYQLLAGSTSELLHLAADIALGHHEWWNGSGYPRGIAGDDIAEVARIAAVADVFDALTSNRVYRPAVAVDHAIATMTDLRGLQFEPRLLDAFLELIDETAVIRDRFPERAEGESQIRVLVVDGHEIFVERLVRLLGAHPSVKVVGTANTVTMAEQAAIIHEPDVILMDFDLPDGDGIASAARITSRIPATKVVMLTDRTDHQAFVRAIGAGCAGFVTKTEPVETLVGAIRAASEDDELPPVIDLPKLLSGLDPTSRQLGLDLGRRELEVLRLVASGLSNKAIAERLYISVNTVRNHVKSILQKLDAHSRLEAVATAVREGLIERDVELAQGD